jgi:hypothetical protein
MKSGNGSAIRVIAGKKRGRGFGPNLFSSGSKIVLDRIENSPYIHIQKTGTQTQRRAKMEKQIVKTTKENGFQVILDLTFDLANKIALHHYLDAYDIREELKAGYTIETDRCTYKAI